MLVPYYASEVMMKTGIPIKEKYQPCKSKDQWGNIDFIIGGKKYTTYPDEYMFEQKLDGNKKQFCHSAIMPIATDHFLLGQRFMRKYYTIFDRDNDRLGFT